VVSDLKLCETSGYPNQTYKDMEYRDRIANRYGIYLMRFSDPEDEVSMVRKGSNEDVPEIRRFLAD